MNTPQVHEFSVISKDGEKVLQKDFLSVWCVQNEGNFGLERFEWEVNGVPQTKSANGHYLYLVPDLSGFLDFEGGYAPNNCTLLDAYGKVRMRLTVPWSLTKEKNQASSKAPTCFAGISKPYVNPVTGRVGEFGVKAWVEHSGEYYFELDWKNGEFLWGKEIRF